MMINTLIVEGRLVRDVETKVLSLGKTVTKFAIAVEGWKEKVNFFNVVVWGETAKNCAKYIKKGSRVIIEGNMDQDRWEEMDGRKRSSVYINARLVHFLFPVKVDEDDPDDHYSGHIDEAMAEMTTQEAQDAGAPF